MPPLPPTPNDPLSLQGEGWGEGAESPPNTAITGKRKPLQPSTSHRTPCRSAPCARIAGRARSYRSAPPLPTTPNDSLSLWERAGVRAQSNPQPRNHRQTPSTSKPLQPSTSHRAPCRSAPCARIVTAWLLVGASLLANRTAPPLFASKLAPTKTPYLNRRAHSRQPARTSADPRTTRGNSAMFTHNCPCQSSTRTPCRPQLRHNCRGPPSPP